jgi:hypothetical protein
MINFWLDPWCGELLALAFDIPHHSSFLLLIKGSSTLAHMQAL